jgi:hypothetical protein
MSYLGDAVLWWEWFVTVWLVLGML